MLQVKFQNKAKIKQAMFIPSLAFSKVKYLFLVILSLVLNSVLHAKELIISEIKNKIENVDIYGNKFILNKNYIIKNGDFVKSKNQNSYFVFNNVKICLAKNSSVKFKEIKSKNVILEHIKGNVLVNKIKNKSLKVEISIYKKFIFNVKDKVYINQFNKNKFIVRSFFGLSYKPFYSKQAFRLKNNTAYKYDAKFKETKVSNILKDPLIINCLTNKKIIDADKNYSFACIQNGKKLVCGYK